MSQSAEYRSGVVYCLQLAAGVLEDTDTSYVAGDCALLAEFLDRVSDMYATVITEMADRFAAMGGEG